MTEPTPRPRPTCDVSVVVPAYKASGTIARTLASVFAQTVLPREIIVVNDASPDTDALIDAVEALDVPDGVDLQLVHNPQNLNGAATRNRGIQAAQGAFVAFLDADDEWEADKLALSLEALSAAHGPAFAYSQVRVIAEGRPAAVRPARGIGAAEHMSEYLFLSGGFVQTSTIVCPRDLATKVLFDPEFRRHQDYDFCLRLAAEGATPVFVPKPLVRYHANGGVFGTRREESAYTSAWGQTMRPWMSRHGYYGFKFFLVSGRLAGEKRYGKALMTALQNAVALGPMGLWKARPKIAALTLAILRR